MKKVLLVVGFLLIAGSAFAQTYVRPYVRSNGTMVQGHWRSQPNNTKRDNYTTQGNHNPYTGSKGYRTYEDYNNYGYGQRPEQDDLDNDSGDE